MILALAAALGLVLSPRPAQAHPAHAEEPETPFVAGFERFYSAQDPDDYLAAGGRLLLNELNCVACHLPPDELRADYPGVPGPDLKGIGSRITDPAALMILIRNPRFLKRGTIMPSVFAASDRDEEVVDALFHYLLSLREPVAPLKATGDAERGQELYHTIGCVACHAPGLEYRPPALPPEAKQENPAFPSYPIRLATYWSEEFLTQYLLDPARYHPSGRMPDFGLSDAEAADIAVYLQITNPAEAPGLPAPDPTLARKGEALFQAQGCAACHDAGRGYQPLAATPLLQLNGSGEGCLADLPQPGGIPHFFLAPFQKKALQLGIASLAAGNAGDDPPDLALTRNNCYACHTYDGRGGPELAREPYFGAGDPRALDREDHLPPDLKGVTRRRSRSELLQILTGQAAEPHYPKVGARMIVLPAGTAERLIDLLETADQGR